MPEREPASGRDPGRHGYDDVRLRAVRSGDLGHFFAFQRDPEAARLAAATPLDRAAFLDQWAEIRADPGVVARTVLLNGAVAGNITCWERWDEWQVGYWVGRAYWGRGVATTALGLLLCEVTERPLHAYAAAHNLGSRRVLEKCGFTRVADEAADPVLAARSTLIAFVLD